LLDDQTWRRRRLGADRSGYQRERKQCGNALGVAASAAGRPGGHLTAPVRLMVALFNTKKLPGH